MKKLKENARIAFVRDEGTSPVASPNTRLVAAAITAGTEFAGDHPLVDTVEELPHGGVKRQTTWIMDADSKLTFSPNFKEETISFPEFRQRYEDIEWCNANPDHPIAYLRLFSDNYSRLLERVKTLKPMALIRRGNSKALIPFGTPRAKVEEILSRL